MIFVTIGTQEPFDRLIRTMDEISSTLIGVTVVAQTFGTGYRVKNMKTLDFVPPKEFNEYFDRAKLIVAHAGMGTIISALERQKPIIVLPRLTKYKEHRSDHQLATARMFDKLKNVHVAYSEHELNELVQEIVHGDLNPGHKLGKYASPELIQSIQSDINRQLKAYHFLQMLGTFMGYSLYVALGACKSWLVLPISTGSTCIFLPQSLPGLLLARILLRKSPTIILST